MARLASLTPRKVVAILKANGFVEDHQTGSHLVLWNPTTKARVVVPIHSRDVPRGTLIKILKMAGVDVEVR